MSDRVNFYFRQQVAENELDLAFEQVEAADRALLTDAVLTGICSGLEVLEDSPTPDLQVRVAAGTAYDLDGQRCRVPSTQIVDVSVDEDGEPTAVTLAGNTKIVSVFLRFIRAESDPRTDGLGNPVNFVRAESFEIFVRQGGETPDPDPTPPALDPEAVLLADVTLAYGQTAVVEADIDLDTRREYVFRLPTSLAIPTNGTAIRVGTTAEAVDAVLQAHNDHVGGLAARHPAAAVEMAAGPAWKDGAANPGGGTAQAFLDSVVQLLGEDLGAGKIGTAGVTGVPNSLVAGASVQGQLAALLGFLNAATSAAGIAYAAGPAWADGTTNPATTVQLEINKIISDLAGGNGSPKIGAPLYAPPAPTPAVQVSPVTLTATENTVRKQIEKLLDHQNAHIVATAAHPSENVSHAGTPNWQTGAPPAGTDVKAVLNAAITELATSAATSGAHRVGAPAAGSGLPSVLTAGSVASQLVALLGAVNTRVNLGENVGAASANGGTGYADVFRDKTGEVGGQTANFKRLRAGVGTTIVNDADDITITNTTSGGDVTGGANVGAGAGLVFRDKIAGVLNFRRLLGTARLTVGVAGDDVTADVNVGAAFTWGNVHTFNNDVEVNGDHILGASSRVKVGGDDITIGALAGQDTQTTLVAFGRSDATPGASYTVAAQFRAVYPASPSTFTFTTLTSTGVGAPIVTLANKHGVAISIPATAASALLVAELVSST